MIPISAQAQLLIAAALFYAYDACLLLYANEGIATPTWRGWRVSSAHNRLSILGKNLYIPNLLLAHRPLYRLAWNSSRIDLHDAENWPAKRKLPGIFSYTVYACAASIFLLLPLAIGVARSETAILLSVACIYLHAILAGAVTLRFSKQLGLTPKNAWSIALECICCPPFAINVIRKLSLQSTTQSNLVGAAFTLLNPEQWQVLQETLVQSIDQESAESDDPALLSAYADAKTLLLNSPKHAPH